MVPGVMEHLPNRILPEITNWSLFQKRGISAEKALPKIIPALITSIMISITKDITHNAGNSIVDLFGDNENELFDEDVSGIFELDDW